MGADLGMLGDADAPLEDALAGVADEVPLLLPADARLRVVQD